MRKLFYNKFISYIIKQTALPFYGITIDDAPLHTQGRCSIVRGGGYDVDISCV